VASSPASAGAGGQDRAPYLEAIERYAASRPLRFNVPGHKGGAHADPELVRALGPALDLDVPPLVHGVDVGPHPTPYEEARALAAEAWGAARTWFVVNGASHANQAAGIALAGRGEAVLVQRNVHSSVIDALVVSGLRPLFLEPIRDPELGIAHTLAPAILEAALDQPGLAGVVVSSPTYFGACADLPVLVEVCHARGLPILVDEAWGAHFAFHPELPGHAIAAGADLVTSSTHKMLGSLTQSAMLHLGPGSLIAEETVDRAVTLLESTSRSAILVASLDAARRRAADEGRELIGASLSELPAIREAVRAVPGLDLLEAGDRGAVGVAAFDPLRLAITTPLDRDGIALAARARELGGAIFELSSPRVLVAALGLGEGLASLQPLLDALATALDEGAGAAGPILTAPTPGATAMTPREGFLARREPVPTERAVGRVSAETVTVYPPGIPVAIVGETLTAATLEHLRVFAAAGATIRGATDPSLDTVAVVRDPA
jgi:arginine decarboxylase